MKFDTNIKIPSYTRYKYDVKSMKVGDSLFLGGMTLEQQKTVHNTFRKYGSRLGLKFSVRYTGTSKMRLWRIN